MKKLFMLTIIAVNAYASDGLPDGPWRNSCDNSKAAMINGKLTAFCKSDNFLGGSIVSFDYLTNCKSGSLVDYKDGKLVCYITPSPTSVVPIAPEAKLPSGPWLNHCSKQTATFVDGQLKASCSANNGLLGTTQATLDYSTNCKSGASVDYQNGELICVAEATQPKKRQDLPGGDWVSSCKTQQAELNGSMLITKCQNDSGSYVSAAVDLSKCAKNSTVSNNDGQLTCNSLAYYDGLPGGDWRDYCEVKSAEITRTNTFKARCKTWSGHYMSTFIFYDQCKQNSDVNYDTDKQDLYCVSKK